LLRSVIAGVVYFATGMVFAALAGAASSNQARVGWRLAAWAFSGDVFLAHIWYERFRLGNPPRSAAVRVALGAAIGAFGLAVAATIHSLTTGNYRAAYLLSLVAWPAITALPAFLVALGAGTMLGRLSRR
jgi:peptidoglycan/LPS O-acetylase OafA/YrhL